MKILCKYLGGSFSYGLNTESSDQDFRGIFINDELGKLIGLDRFEHLDVKSKEKDEFYFELRHFFCLLRKGSTVALELLFNENWIEISPQFKLIQKHRQSLVDFNTIFKSLKGYIFSELKLANGERTGQLGSKRKIAIEKYGFSPKNFVNLFRLAFCGVVLFNKGYFPVNILKEDSNLAKFLIDIKQNPCNFTKDVLNNMVKNWEQELDFTFQNRKLNFKFNNEIANKLCLEIYYPLIKEKFENWSERLII